MKRLRSLLAGFLAALALGALVVPASAGASAAAAQDQSRSDQGEARKAMKAGNIKTIGEIERLVLPRMRGAEYLGFAYDATARAYRLKFIKEGRVINVDVDGATGRIINRSR
ncbi:hypothetical protein [Erythrobacter sp. HL-111]|uniref:hypothetical protein n=1 Tax=Erythrobacter sp. HL-111 TaxID=1798193 RepID=UPI0006D9E361|nr:hypothetical protein [Erythrobacter sp. HL-111]KPP96252.1 MAG: Peptidase propeptide and YPEB domain [Erythrobacteraceae bacterium HL-111]SDR76225.1 hypothetical protein SAMN04515621_0297 [Erythrobacter sp. HL-111]